MTDAEADKSTLPACALSTCHCQAVLANDRSAFGIQRRNHIEGVSPCRCRSLIVHRNRALMMDGEKDGSRGRQISERHRTLNAKRRTSFAGHAVQLFDGFSVQHSSSSDGIDITFPERYDNGRYAIADQVRHRTADADKPINRQNQDKTTTGIAGIAFKVAARITIADPGIPCAPFEVISETKRTKARSCNDKGVLVACAIKTTARVR